MRDVDFLALLVHRGVVPRAVAQGLAQELGGREGELDRLLCERLGFPPAEVARLRRTRGGEVPEIPGLEVQQKLGTGGTADVWKVREKASGRTFALKVLKPEATRHEPTRKAFIAEARLLERLSHPGLVACHGIAKSGNTFFSRLEWIDGRTVLELIDTKHLFREEEALGLVLAVAEVLRYLSSQGVVHRDVKPGNVMLARDGRVVLIDLGFAAGEAERSAEGKAVGTVAYLSPEQCLGGASADIRSDIYSLGISLYQMLFGRLPFEGSDDQETLRKQVMESLNSRELKRRDVSPHLHYFIEKMVAKDACDRYQSWGELIQDVSGHLAGRADLDFEREARERRGRR